MCRLRALLCWVVLMWMGSAWALVPTVTQYRPLDPKNGPWYASNAEACTASKAWFELQFAGSTAPTTTLNFCIDGLVSLIRSNGVEYREGIESRGGQCPPNSTASGSACACDANYQQSGNECIPALPPKATCNAREVVSTGWYDGGTSVSGGPPPVVCSSGCMAVFDGYYPSGNAVVNGEKHYYGKGSYVKNGFNCDSGTSTGSGGGTGSGSGMAPAPEPGDSVPPDTCKAGQAPGQVNGKTVCVDTGTGKVTDPTTTNQQASDSTTTKQTNPDGTTTEIETTKKTNPDGTGSETIKTTIRNPDGSVKSENTQTTGTEVDKQAEEGKCEKNAADAGCGGDPSAVNAGQIYTGKGKTVASVLDSAKTTLQGSAVGSAVSNFFSVSGGGTCPSSTWHIPYLKADVSMESFCSDTAQKMYLLVRSVLMLVASFMAFRIAIE